MLIFLSKTQQERVKYSPSPIENKMKQLGKEKKDLKSGNDKLHKLALVSIKGIFSLIQLIISATEEKVIKRLQIKNGKKV